MIIQHKRYFQSYKLKHQVRVDFAFKVLKFVAKYTGLKKFKRAYLRLYRDLLVSLKHSERYDEIQKLKFDLGCARGSSKHWHNRYMDTRKIMEKNKCGPFKYMNTD